MEFITQLFKIGCDDSYYNSSVGLIFITFVLFVLQRLFSFHSLLCEVDLLPQAVLLLEP